MSREIKFRAWHDKNKRMYYSHRKDGSDNPIWSWDAVFRYHATDKSTHIMQFAGLKDKAGVDIYEGDIFKAFDGEVFEVIKYNGAFGYTVDKYFPFIPFANHIHLLFDADGKCDQIEIVGNVHTTPELLEK